MPACSHPRPTPRHRATLALITAALALLYPLHAWAALADVIDPDALWRLLGCLLVSVIIMLAPILLIFRTIQKRTLARREAHPHDE